MGGVEAFWQMKEYPSQPINKEVYLVAFTLEKIMTKIFPQNNKQGAVFFNRINCIAGNKMSSKIRAKQIGK